jgi:hypothetical protein
MLVSAAPVLLLDDPTFIAARASLAETLANFRRRHGFGRAISAPQIG